ncbi:metallophosphoesterase [Myxococcota bacterium]|nr:metallophosphoesterase [Myxococcota bacterium]MBU1537197.1 metallophosphoesterase [Myxococcota bacterium]
MLDTMMHASKLLFVILLIPLISCRTKRAPAAPTTDLRPAQVTFSFVQITDTHLGHGDHDQRTLAVINAINTLPYPVDFVVHTGDIFMDNMLEPRLVEKAAALFGRLKIPCYFVPGNHDILTKHPGETRTLFKKHFGPLAKRVIHKGVPLLFLYTEPLAGGCTFSDYSPLAALSALAGKNLPHAPLLFHHSPSVPDFYGGKFHQLWTAKIRRKWAAALKKIGTIAIFAGHFHRDELQYLGDIPLHVAPPVASYWGRQATFRVYTYDRGRITYRNHYIHR